jgi:hypothetical protein
MHLEEFIELLEQGLGDGFGYVLKFDGVNRIEWRVEEDPTDSVFGLTFREVADLRRDEAVGVIGDIFDRTIERLRRKAEELDAGDADDEGEEEKT